MRQLHAPGGARTLALPEMRLGAPFPFTVLPSPHSRPTSSPFPSYLSESWRGFAFAPFIHLSNV